MKTTRHATYNLNYHLVWIPKSRQSVLTGEVADRVRTILHEIADEKGLDVQNLTVQSDHVHLFVSSPPKHSPSLLANWFKGISSRKYNHRHADHDGEKFGGGAATTLERPGTSPAKQSRTTSTVTRRLQGDRTHENARTEARGPERPQASEAS